MSDVRCAECDCTDGSCNWIMSAGEPSQPWRDAMTDDYDSHFDAPRAVKAVYKKTNLMKYARADNYWVWADDWSKAEEAWEQYLSSLKKVGENA